MLAATIAFLLVPVFPSEPTLWRQLRIRKIRKWITGRRSSGEIYHRSETLEKARNNLKWHILLTVLFCMQLAMAVVVKDSWWRPLTLPLFIFSLAYFVGSVVQRQKIAITILRKKR
jgi:hypothetical protein